MAAPTGEPAEVLDLQARFEERGAELELMTAEKRRLQQLVDDLKRGNMEGVYRQAKEEAEKEVLRRMLSTKVDLTMG